MMEFIQKVCPAQDLNVASLYGCAHTNDDEPLEVCFGFLPREATDNRHQTWFAIPLEEAEALHELLGKVLDNAKGVK